MLKISVHYFMTSYIAVPRYTSLIHIRQYHYPPWLTGEVIKSIRVKAAAYARYKKRKAVDLLDVFFSKPIEIL